VLGGHGAMERLSLFASHRSPRNYTIKVLIERKTMKAYQLTIPAENKPGVLSQITSILARKKIDRQNYISPLVEMVKILAQRTRFSM
jgi:hypothetical protein